MSWFSAALNNISQSMQSVAHALDHSIELDSHDAHIVMMFLDSMTTSKLEQLLKAVAA